EAVDRRLDVLLLQTGVEDHHKLVFTHATVTSSGLERPPDGSRSVNPPEGSSGPNPGQRGLAAASILDRTTPRSNTSLSRPCASRPGRPQAPPGPRLSVPRRRRARPAPARRPPLPPPRGHPAPPPAPPPPRPR